MKKWSIVALLGISLAAICLGSVIAFIPVASRVFTGGFQWNLLSGKSISAEAEEELRAPVDGPATLVLNTPFGNVEIDAAEGSREIVIRARKTAWGTNRQSAEELLQKTKIVMVQDGNSVKVYVDQPVEVDLLHIGPAGIGVDFTVSVPVDCAVEAASSSGSLHLSGTTGDAYLNSSFGDVKAENVSGLITATTGSGDVILRDIRAGGEAVEASSSFGDVQVLDSQGGTLAAKSSSGEVTVEHSIFTSRAELATSFGDVNATGLKADSLDARTNSGEVILHDLEIQKTLTAHSDFGDVEVLGSTAQRYDLDTNSGEITASDVSGSVKARSGFGDIGVHGTDAVLDLSTSSGSIEFTGSLGAGTSILHTNFGDIRVRLPEDASFVFDLSTNFGNVDCGFPAVSGRNGTTHLAGTIGAGGPLLEASTNSGSISVQPQTAG